MKTSNKLGAVALTAALAMSSIAPAFANNPVVHEGTVGNYGGVGTITQNGANQEAQAGTTVNGHVFKSQLKVTIPMQLGVALPAEDGAIIMPGPLKITGTGASATRTGYGIINEGDSAVFVTNVKADAAKVEHKDVNGKGKDVTFKLVDAPARPGASETEDQIGINLTFGASTTSYALKSGTGTDFKTAADKLEIAGNGNLPISLAGDVKWHGVQVGGSTVYQAPDEILDYAMKITKIEYTVSTVDPSTATPAFTGASISLANDWTAVKLTNLGALNTYLSGLSAANLTTGIGSELAGIMAEAKKAYDGVSGFDNDTQAMLDAAKTYIEDSKNNLTSKIKFVA